MEQATAVDARSGTKGAPGGGVEERLAGLRLLAETQPDAARDAAWLWIREAGERDDVAELDEIFRHGNVPSGLDGPTDGILVTPQIHPSLDRVVKSLTPHWMPWVGKRFNSAAATGDNRLVDSSRIPTKMIWPRYQSRAAPERGPPAFDFETRVEP